MGDSAVEDAGGQGSHRRGRAALLRLARWFDAADAPAAHDVYAAAFAAYPARFLGGAGDEAAPAAASWWNSPPAHVAAAPADGPLPTAAVPDHSDQRARLRDAAEARAHWRRSAAAEVRTALAGGAERLELSTPALDVLMELLTAALGSGSPEARQVTAGDLELGVRLHVGSAPGARIAIASPGGGLDLADVWLRVTDHAEQGPLPEPGDAGADEGADEEDRRC
ncbi:DUF2397 family protein [Nocardiopsis composta]|uniref:DUF2397 family protein n=1 Tax=Nocardiopsis composta TaxID=157465 RepID=A0A7W8VEM2_9ACTN|nr:DUF2397 family protein [Nocardiopsis composta]MBB5433089.1 hypothetical protein [Nocardiopsis composta]